MARAGNRCCADYKFSGSSNIFFNLIIIEAHFNQIAKLRVLPESCFEAADKFNKKLFSLNALISICPIAI